MSENRPLADPAADLTQTLHALTQGDPAQRRQAARQLAKRGDPAAIPGLLIACRDPDDAVRASVMVALGYCRDERALAALIAALDDHQPDVRTAAIRALGRYDAAPAAIDPLIAGLTDERFAIRTEVVKTLGRLGDPRALPALIARLDDPEITVRRAAVKALGQFEEHAALDALLILLDEADRDIVQHIVAALQNIPDERAIMPLVKLLNDHDPHIWHTTVKALIAIGEAVIEPVLAAYDARRAHPYSVAVIIQALRAPAGVPALKSMLDDRQLVDHDLRLGEFAAQALKQIGTPEALAALDQRRTLPRRKRD